MQEIDSHHIQSIILSQENGELSFEQLHLNKFDAKSLDHSVNNYATSLSVPDHNPSYFVYVHQGKYVQINSAQMPFIEVKTPILHTETQDTVQAQTTHPENFLVNPSVQITTNPAATHFDHHEIMTPSSAPNYAPPISNEQPAHELQNAQIQYIPNTNAYTTEIKTAPVETHNNVTPVLETHPSKQIHPDNANPVDPHTHPVEHGTIESDAASFGEPAQFSTLPRGLALFARNASGAENDAIDLNIHLKVRGEFTANSKATITLSGIPDGATLSAGTDNGDGSWTLRGEQLKGLTFQPGMGENAYQIQVDASFTTANNLTFAKSATFIIKVDAAGDLITGTLRADKIHGTEWSDKIYAGVNNDLVYGKEGFDKLYGEQGNDRLYGDAGNDFLSGGSGNDLLFGGVGNDILIGGAGLDRYYGEAGDDTFYVSGSDDANDLFYGGEGFDSIITSGGDIYLRALNQNASIEVINAHGNDIFGTNSANTLDFRATELQNVGVIDGQGGNDRIYGDSGDNTIIGGAGADRLYGEGGNDIIIGGDGADRLYGALGNDILVGGSGVDRLYGQEGDDVFFVNGLNDAYDQFFGGEGFDTIITTGADIYLRGLNQNASIEVINAHGNDIFGNNSANTLDFRATDLQNVGVIDGQGGNDRIYGDSGDNTIIGGAGADRLYGEGGDDTFYVNGLEDANDLYYGGEGFDSIITTNGDIYLRGLNQNASIETIDAKGHDIFGTNSNNTLDFRGTDLQNVGVIDGQGGNDRIFGDAGDNTIIGGAGTDRLYGEGGDDTFYVNGLEDANDLFYGGEGVDSIISTNGDIYFRGLNQNSSIEVINANGHDIFGNNNGNTLDFRASDLQNVGTIDGQGGNDRIYGNADDNTITGGSGNDRLYGEGGNDIFLFDLGDGSDRAYGGRGGWVDVIKIDTLGSNGEAPNADNWVLQSNANYTIDTANKIIAFDSEDARGSITLSDGSVLQFYDMEEIHY